MKAYKVVRRVESGGEARMVSAFVFARCFPSFVFYVPDEKTEPKPKCGPLTAFGGSDDAFYWMNLQDKDDLGPLEVWECKVELEEDERLHNIWYYIPEMDVMQTMKGVWTIPQGTIYCKSIILTKQAKE